MIAMQTTVNVPADRRVTLTLPPDTPLGPLTLIVTATQNNGNTVENSDADRRNPDTQEFREKVEHTEGLAFDLRDWRIHLLKQAELEGRDPQTVKAMLIPTPENKMAFTAWREARRNEVSRS